MWSETHECLSSLSFQIADWGWEGMPGKETLEADQGVSYGDQTSKQTNKVFLGYVSHFPHHL